VGWPHRSRIALVVIPWSRGRCLRIVPSDYERLLEVVAADAQRIDGSRLAGDVSALFHA